MQLPLDVRGWLEAAAHLRQSKAEVYNCLMSVGFVRSELRNQSREPMNAQQQAIDNT